jgi:hypothetical protein
MYERRKRNEVEERKKKKKKKRGVHDPIKITFTHPEGFRLHTVPLDGALWGDLRMIGEAWALSW